MGYKDLVKHVELEYEKLLNENKSDELPLETDKTVDESTKFMKYIPKYTQSVVIQVQTNNSNESYAKQTGRIHLPFAITLISLVQIGLYLFDSMYRHNCYFSLMANKLLFTTADKQQVWRFLSYMFVHKDFLHLSMNIFYQMLGGVPLEILHGWWRITIVYLAGVLGGSLGVEAISSCKALVGASGGVYSILGANFASLLLNWNETEDRFIRAFILLVYVLTDIFNWVSMSILIHNSGFGSTTCKLISELTNTTITHFCGCLVGTLTAIIILKNIYVHSWERKTQKISLIVLTLVSVLAVFLIIFVPEFNIKSLIVTFECDKKLQNSPVLRCG